MIRIRTKLLAYFFVLILLMNAVAYFLYHSGQTSLTEYNQFLERLYLLNEVSKESDDLYKTLDSYLVERTPEYYQKYLNERLKLKNLRDRLEGTIENDNNYLQLENYQNMMTSFLDECGIVSDAFQKQKVDVYSDHLSEAENILGFIHQTTLNLTNNELTHYKGFYKNMNQKNYYFRFMVIMVFISTFLLSVMIALRFSRGITRPIGKLTAAAREISRGKFDGKRVEVTTHDEMQFLTNTFNDMRSNIRGLIAEIKKQSELDRLLKEMELKSLQSQINPHFLFNVLNTISKTAYLEDAPETNQLINSTAALLRYNLGNLDRPTTLGREVEIINEYFFLQTARFGDRVTFTVDTDKACLGIAVPNLTLQPLVENAFIHGIETIEEDAEICLVIKEKKEFVLVEVIDNGVGMAETTARRLLDLKEEGKMPEPHGHSTGLGFKNVIRRLELFYGVHDIVAIDSAFGKGTKISLFLPKDNMEGESLL